MAIAAYNKSVYITTTGGSTWNEIPGTNASLSMGGDLLDDTDFLSTGYRSRIIGLRDYTVSVTANYGSTSSAINLLKTAWLNRTRLDFRYLPTGSDGWSGKCQVESLDISGDVGGLEQVDVSLVADGPLSTST